MKLSILDQSPIATGQSAQEALQASLQLAQEGDRLGYSRIWLTEHHDLPGLACSVPEVFDKLYWCTNKKYPDRIRGSAASTL
ncbi:hypothetical protein RCO48_25430 [Peribacillus frigoritolerans]|nr:hypothetical protein [Peribacillus frigoritolerans]